MSRNDQQFKFLKAWFSLIVVSLALGLNSCYILNGIAGPTFIKLYPNIGSEVQIKSALNILYERYPENVISIPMIKRVHSNFISDSIVDSSEEEEIKRDYFYFVPPNPYNKIDNWRLKSANELFIYNIETTGCNEVGLNCTICLNKALIIESNESWKNYEFTFTERKMVLKEFEKDILLKIKRIIENEIK